MIRANGFLSAVMQLSMGAEVAVGEIMLRLFSYSHGHSQTMPELRVFHLAITTMDFLAPGPVVDSLSLPTNSGAETNGHRRRDIEINPT